MQTRMPMHLWLIKLLNRHLMPFIFDINPLSPADKRAKGAKRRLKIFDVQVKNLMTALGKIIERALKFLIELLIILNKVILCTSTVFILQYTLLNNICKTKHYKFLYTLFLIVLSKSLEFEKIIL